MMLHKIFFTSFIIGFLTFTSWAQSNTEPTGEWLLQKVEENGEVKVITQLVDFNIDGVFYVQETPFGTWHYNSKTKVLNFYDNKVSGAYKTLFRDSGVMQLSLDSKHLFFKKINREQILDNNQKSGLIGKWVTKDTFDYPMSQILVFNDPDWIKLIKKGEGTTSTSSGTWLYYPKEKELIIIGQFEGFRGVNKQVLITDSILSFENKGQKIILDKVVQGNKKIERLLFSESDFYDENGDYKYYDDEERLPWRDPYHFFEYLSTIHKLIYKYSELIEESQTFDTKTLVADITVNKEEDTFQIDNIFDGYDRYNMPDDYEFPSNNYSNFSPLYPFKGDVFRVSGSEDIKVPAGTFKCTVIETTTAFDDKVKLWMINDKPGVIAKVIIDKPGDFGKYVLYELEGIK